MGNLVQVIAIDRFEIFKGLGCPIGDGIQGVQVLAQEHRPFLQDAPAFMESIHFVVSANIDQKDFSLAQELEDHPAIKAHAECPEPFKSARQFMSSQTWVKRIFCKHFHSVPKSALELSIVLYLLSVHLLESLVP